MQTWYTDMGAYDVGGGWNVEGYGQVELIESHATKEEFMRDYKLYVELLRNLADEAGIPKTLDSDSLAGIKTHQYCTYNQPRNYSDHVDPYPYLAKWGISVSNSRKILKVVYLKLAGNVMKPAGGGRSQMALIRQNSWKKINNEWFYFDETWLLLNQSLVQRW